MLSAIYPTTGPYGLSVFVLVTLCLGGAAAWATGRAIAMTWRPRWHIVAYVMLLAAVARFLQFALFGQPLLSAQNLAIDAAVLLAISLLSQRVTRARQMVRQYPWAFTRRGRFGWMPVAAAADARISGNRSA